MSRTPTYLEKLAMRDSDDRLWSRRSFRTIVNGGIQALIDEGVLPSTTSFDHVTAEQQYESGRGEISTNAALVLAKAAGLPARTLAEKLAAKLSVVPSVTHAQVAGAGFVNLTFAPIVWAACLQDILTRKDFGASSIGNGKIANVEYVSANPTGPLHVGNGRGAVIGDVLASLLAKIGYTVTREYYINDAGGQVDTLARSVYVHYQNHYGLRYEPPANFYPGDYVRDIALDIAAHFGATWCGRPESDWLPVFRATGVQDMMRVIRDDLDLLGIYHDIFTSEQALIDQNLRDEIVQRLLELDYAYRGTLPRPIQDDAEDWQPEEQLLFRATKHGDSSDRTLRKPDGAWTYFANDIAYHYDKQRRCDLMIDVWGADHGGYVSRLKGSIQVIGSHSLDVVLYSLVNLFDNGVALRMGKRSGTTVNLREVIERVGKDAFRFTMLTRGNMEPLDFDFAKVVEQSKDNPVFYVQYAHARASSAMRMAREHLGTEHPLFADGVDISVLCAAMVANPLEHPLELALIRRLNDWPHQVESAALAREPHRIAFYLRDVATAFHGLWTYGDKTDESLRFIQKDNIPLTLARLALVQGVLTVIGSGLRLMGVEPMESM